MNLTSPKSIFAKNQFPFIILILSVLLSSCAGGGSSDEAKIDDPTTEPPTNKPAVITITSQNGAVYNNGDTETLQATAIDDEDGDISANISWDSDIDGFLGAGASIDVQLSTGTHALTASVTDSGNLSVNSGISTTVNAPAYGDALLSWTRPTQNTDNSALTDLAGYKVYYGQSATTLTESISLNDPDLTQYLIDSLPTQTTFYFAISAVNSLGIESELSNVSSKFIQG